MLYVKTRAPRAWVWLSSRRTELCLSLLCLARTMKVWHRVRFIGWAFRCMIIAPEFHFKLRFWESGTSAWWIVTSASKRLRPSHPIEAGQSCFCNLQSKTPRRCRRRGSASNRDLGFLEEKSLLAAVKEAFVAFGLIAVALVAIVTLFKELVELEMLGLVALGLLSVVKLAYLLCH